MNTRPRHAQAGGQMRACGLLLHVQREGELGTGASCVRVVVSGSAVVDSSLALLVRVGIASRVRGGCVCWSSFVTV